MASVQVRILQSGRTDFYGLPLTPGSVVTVDRDYAVSLVSAGFASWVNLADVYDGETNFRKPSEIYTLYQGGIPFAIFAGDGGSNGFNFTGTCGVFTLSAAPIQYITAFTRACYAYIPAGAGGLAAGWYWCVMSDDTNGEIFAETYLGTGTPKYIASPTRLSNCTAGRITQTTAEVTATSFVMPGGSMGPNGIWQVLFATRGSTAAGVTKTTRVRIGGTRVYYNPGANSVIDASGVFQNQGIETRQTGVSHAVGRDHLAHNAMSTFDVSETLIDTRVDQTVLFTLQLAANTETLVGLLRRFAVQYGA